MAALLGGAGRGCCSPSSPRAVWSYLRGQSGGRAGARRRPSSPSRPSRTCTLTWPMDWLADDPDKTRLQQEVPGDGRWTTTRNWPRLTPPTRPPAAAPPAPTSAWGNCTACWTGPTRRWPPIRQAIDRQVAAARRVPRRAGTTGEDLAESYNWRGELLREAAKSLDRGRARLPQGPGATGATGRAKFPDGAEPTAVPWRAATRTWPSWKWTRGGPRTRWTTTTRRSASCDDLVDEHAKNTEFRHELARTLTNRGVLSPRRTASCAGRGRLRRAIDAVASGCGRRAWPRIDLRVQPGHRRAGPGQPPPQPAPLRRRADRRCARRKRSSRRLAEDFPDPRALPEEAGADLQQPRHARWRRAGGRRPRPGLLGEGPRCCWPTGRATTRRRRNTRPTWACLGNLGWLRLGRNDPSRRAPAAGGGRPPPAERRTKPAPAGSITSRPSAAIVQSLAEALVQLGGPAGGGQGRRRPSPRSSRTGRWATTTPPASSPAVRPWPKRKVADPRTRGRHDRAGRRPAAAGSRPRDSRGDERLADEDRSFRPLAAAPRIRAAARRAGGPARPAAAASGLCRPPSPAFSAHSSEAIRPAVHCAIRRIAGPALDNEAVAVAACAR